MYLQRVPRLFGILCRRLVPTQSISDPMNVDVDSNAIISRINVNGHHYNVKDAHLTYSMPPEDTGRPFLAPRLEVSIAHRPFSGHPSRTRPVVGLLPALCIFHY